MRISVYILILIILTSCHSQQKKENEDVREFLFPIFVDNEQPMKSNKIEEWRDHGNHYPMFFGKLTDTINIGHWIWPAGPPPQPPGSEEKPYVSKKGKFDDYFLDWLIDKKLRYWDSAKLEIYIDTTQTITNSQRNAYPVLIKNVENDTINIGYGNHIPLITEAQTENGKWKPIEERFIYMCGNGVPTIILPPNEFVLSSQLIYSGNYRTKLRVRLGQHYSREFEGTIYKSQFESEWTKEGNSKVSPNNLIK